MFPIRTARLAAAGIRIGPHTATPDWFGERLDLHYALDVLRDRPAAIASGVRIAANTSPVLEPLEVPGTPDS